MKPNNTTAGDFLAHINAGLNLQDWGGELHWIGTMLAWNHYANATIDEDHDCHALGPDGHCRHKSHG
jgi:hypothetical protein